MGRVVHFEIQVDDVERARAFYGDAFGWTFVDWGEVVPGMAYWGVTTGDDEVPGINGGLLQRTSPRAEGGANAFVCVVEVDDYDAAESRVLAAGGTVVDAKSAMPGMAWVGYYLDTEGNTVGLYQADENAA